MGGSGGGGSSGTDSLKVIELNDYQLYGARRHSTYFTNGSSFFENDNNAVFSDHPDEATVDYKEQFRRTIRQMYAETAAAGGARTRSSGGVADQQYGDFKQRKQQQQQQRKWNKKLTEEKNNKLLYSFIKYIVEKELLLQLIIFFPIILTSLYIVFVEEKPLFTIT